MDASTLRGRRRRRNGRRGHPVTRAPGREVKCTERNFEEFFSATASKDLIGATFELPSLGRDSMGAGSAKNDLGQALRVANEP